MRVESSPVSWERWENATPVPETLVRDHTPELTDADCQYGYFRVEDDGQLLWREAGMDNHRALYVPDATVWNGRRYLEYHGPTTAPTVDTRPNTTPSDTVEYDDYGNPLYGDGSEWV